MADHTYLLEEGRWRALGELLDSQGRAVMVEGESVVKHQEKVWILDSRVKLSGQEKALIQHRYAIRPLEAGGDSMGWVSKNETIGQLIGRFNLVGDSILSVFQSQDGSHTGSEFLIKENDTTYLNRGVLFKGDERISAWIFKLTRRE
ncbi:MAG: hypothetical protein HQL51_01440 [Magnetococcales bacterium]|nr:hypothetical protein [Magnetococcales bacterium]